jgi:hypothetical protein
LRIWFTPRIRRQLRFPAGFGEKLLGRQTVLRGDLGKQQAALPTANDQETVTANLDLFRADGKRRGKQGDFHLQVRKFVGSHWRKSRVLHGGTRRATHDAFAECVIGLDYADAASQPLADMQGHEHATLLRKYAVAGDLRGQLADGNSLGNGLASQA